MFYLLRGEGMGYYKVLGFPMCEKARGYKGLYREEPCFIPGKMEYRIERLYHRYCEYYDTSCGITSELQLDELFALKNWYSMNTSSDFELIYFASDAVDTPEMLNSTYYGIDVVGTGGYSMLGEDFFVCSNERPHSKILKVMNMFFREHVNQHRLFLSLEVANSFLDVLEAINILFPGHIEDEDWRIVHIFNIQKFESNSN